MSYLAEEVQTKWKPILEHEDLTPIKDSHKRAVTAQILENTENAIREARASMSGGFLGEAAPTNSGVAPAGSNVDGFDPVLISLVRRAMPNLMAYDVCGVQPMTGPTGLIFAMRARYDLQNGAETFYNEVDTGHSARGGANASATDAGYDVATDVGGAANTIGTSPSANTNANNALYNFAGGIKTALAEGLGSTSTSIFPEMAFSIEKVSVTAKSRALKAEYSLELAQDLKAIHGLDAETELSNILSAETVVGRLKSSRALCSRSSVKLTQSQRLPDVVRVTSSSVRRTLLPHFRWQVFLTTLQLLTRTTSTLTTQATHSQAF